MRPKRSELETRYGDIDLLRLPAWTDEGLHMTYLPVPTMLQPYLLFLKASGVTREVNRIYLNKDMAVPLNQAFGNILDRGLQSQVKEYGGCFMIRNARGLDHLSVHSFGLAIDINPNTNQLGTDGDMTPEFVACFTDAGFIWGGHWHRKDPQHFQYCTED